MKSTIALVSLILLTVVSCTKDYTCECERTLDGDPYDVTVTTLRNKKKKAENYCKSLSGSSYSGVTKLQETCKLK